MGSCGISAISAPRIARSSALFGESRVRSTGDRVLAEQDPAADDAAGRLDDLQDGLHGHALAATALADDPDDLAWMDVEAHPVDRADEPFVQREVNPEIFDLKNWCRHWL